MSVATVQSVATVVTVMSVLSAESAENRDGRDTCIVLYSACMVWALLTAILDIWTGQSRL